MGAAAEDLVRFVREPVQVNLYVTWGTSQGFATHWDDHDVFVVQVMGSKHWRVHGPGRPFPMKRDVTHDHTCPDTIVWDRVIDAGQVLHVPRGWWHGVRGAGDVSVHLTFGFARRTGIDWAEWIVEQLRHRELFRQELPRFAPAEATQAHEEALRAGLREVLASSSLDGYFAHRDELAPRRHRFCLPLAVDFRMPDEFTPVEFTPLFPHISEDGDRVILSTARKRFVFAQILTPLLNALAQHRALPCADLRQVSGLDDKTFQLALELLIEQQLVTTPIASQ